MKSQSPVARRISSAIIAKPLLCTAVGAAFVLFPSVALAQDAAIEEVQAVPAGPPEGFSVEDSVFDGDWISIGIGAGIGPSYDGSDDYVIFPAPLVQGNLGGIGISPRAAGLALDFLPDSDDATSFSLGPTIRLRNDRADQIEDEVVELAGELDRAVELGVATGISIPKLLNPFDSLSFNLDARWDVAGAHDGMVVEPNVTYFTPLSRGIATSISFSAEFVDDSYADYYYSVSPVQSAASGLPQFEAEGGLNSYGVNLLLGVDLDGNVLNGGLAIVAVGGYSRLVSDAKNTPYTSIRGSADQFFGALGVGYTF